MKIGYLWAYRKSRVMANTAEAVHVQSMCRAFQKLGHQVFIVSGELEQTNEPRGVQCPFPLTVIPSPNPLPVTSWLYQRIRYYLKSQSAQETLPESPRPAGGYLPAWRPHLIWSELEMRISYLRYQRHFYRYARPVLEQERPNVLYQRYTRYGVAGVWLAKDLDVPLVMEMNASLTQPREWFWQPSPFYPWMIKRNEQYLCQHATVVRAVTAVLVPYLRKIGVDEDRILVQPNAVDLELFKPDQKVALAIRKKYGLVRKFVVGFVGFMKHYHDIATLLEGVRLATRSYPDVCALIVGDGPDRSALEHQTEKRGLVDRVVFVGSVPHEEVPGYVGSMDVTAVLSPSADPIGLRMKLFEFMAMCKPVIASRSGQMTDIIQHRKNGMLVQPEDPEEVAEAIVELARNPGLRERLGNAARRTVEAKHTWEHNAQAVIDLCERFGAK